MNTSRSGKDRDDYNNNDVRTANRGALEAHIQLIFGALDYVDCVARFTRAQTAYGAINSVDDLIGHPQFRTRPMQVAGRVAEIPALPFVTSWDEPGFASAPAIGEQDSRLRQEFPTQR